MPVAPSPPLPEQTYFADPALDRLLGVTMALAAEVYVLRSRLRALEARDSESTDAAGDDEDAAAFVARLLAPLKGEQEARGPL